MLAISSRDVLDSTESHDQLTWSFNSNGETFDYLADGETLVLTYTVKVEDDAQNQLNDTETITITITGTNDSPTLVAGSISQTEDQLESGISVDANSSNLLWSY